MINHAMLHLILWSETYGLKYYMFTCFLKYNNIGRDYYHKSAALMETKYSFTKRIRRVLWFAWKKFIF